jgi:hypothetical protein
MREFSCVCVIEFKCTLIFHELKCVHDSFDERKKLESALELGNTHTHTHIRTHT